MVLIIFAGGETGECHRLVPQSPRVWVLAFWHRCQHTDDESDLPRAMGGHCGMWAGRGGGGGS